MISSRLVAHLLITGGLLLLAGVLTIFTAGLDNAGSYALSALATVDRVLAFLSPFPAFVSWALVGLAIGAFAHFFMWEARHFSRGQQRAVGTAGFALLVLYFIALPLFHSLNPERESPRGPWWRADSRRAPGTLREFDGIMFVWVPSPLEGAVIGSPPDETGRQPEETQRPVSFRRGFWMSRDEITWEQYCQTCPESGESLVSGKEKFPAIGLTFEQAEEFARRFSKKTGGGCRIPREDEWEHACRADARSAYSFGHSPNILGEYAWYQGNSGDGPKEVGGLKPNAWNLRDMHGNAAEWCVPILAGAQVYRGGSWKSTGTQCRCAARGLYSPGELTLPDDVGIRLVRDP